MKFRLLLLLVLPLFAFTADQSQAPQFTSTPITQVAEDGYYEYNIDAEDPEGDAYGFKALILPEWLNFGMTDKARVSTIRTFSNPGETERLPKLIAGDDLGNLYMADAGHYVVRKISASGSASILAGSGENKYENGKGTAASFVELQGITVGPDGYIYVSEAGTGTDGKLSHRIRKISPEGEVSNFAGRERTGDLDSEDGTSATFKTPMGLVFDSKGNLFVADHGNFNLRKITPDGAVTTFAGIGEHPGIIYESGIVEGFSSVEALAIDSKDNIYVITTDGNRVLKVNPEGVIEVFSGAGGEGDVEDKEGTAQFIKFWDPKGIAIDREDNVYLTDRNYKVKRISPDGKKVFHLAGQKDVWARIDGYGDEAAFQEPWSLAFDSQGNLYVTEIGSQSLRRLSGTVLSGSPKGYPGVHDVSIEVEDVHGNRSTQDFQINVVDETPPVIVDILRQDPMQVRLSTAQATFRVVFDDPVTNVDETDFSVAAGGAVGTVSTVLAVDTRNYDVMVTDILGIAPLGIELKAGSDIVNDAGYTIEEGSVIGTYETYMGPNLSPVFDPPLTQVADGQEYSHRLVARDPEGGSVEIYEETLPDWISIKKSYSFFEITGPEGNPQGVGITPDGDIYYGVVSNNAASLKRATGRESYEDVLGGTRGYADGASDAALFGGIDDIAADEEGNLYIADAENRSIRKVDTEGNVTTLIGDGPGSGPSQMLDGPLDEATVKEPYGLVMNDEGDLFFTDAGFYSVRKISKDGQVSTLAGGSKGFSNNSGSFAKFGDLRGITIDGEGNLYVVDQGNFRIRKVTQEGNVSTVAGDGKQGSTNGPGTKARFDSPVGITIDSRGNLYVADTGYGQIRKITQSGEVSDAEFNSGFVFAPIGIKYTKDGTFFVTDTYLKRFHASNVTLEGTPNNLSGAFPVEVAASDFFGATTVLNYNIVIFDGSAPVFTSGTSALFEENKTGVVYTAVAEDKAIPIYSLGTGKDEHLFSIDESTGELTFLSIPDFEDPDDANTDNIYEIEIIASDGALEASQDVNITVTNGNDPPEFNSEPVTSISDFEIYEYLPTAFDYENDELTFSAPILPDWLKLVDDIEAEVETFTGTGTKGKRDGSSNVATFDSPYDLSFADNGTLIVADFGNDLLRSVEVTGDVSSFSTALEEPVGVIAESKIFATQNDLHYLEGVDGTFIAFGSGFVDGENHSARMNNPMGMVYDDDSGILYVVDRNNHAIRKVTGLSSATRTVTTLTGNGTAGYADGSLTEARFNQPTHIDLDTEGNLYVVDAGNNRIRKISKNGQVTTLAGNEAIGFKDGQGEQAELNAPFGIAVDKEGNVYFSELGNHTIRRIDTNGLVTTVAGNGTAGDTEGSGTEALFNKPRGLAIDKTGLLYVADEGNHKIRRIQITKSDTQLIGDPKNQFGSHHVSLKVTDANGTSTTQAFTIEIVDGTAPRLVSILRQDPLEEKLNGSTAEFIVTFNEPAVQVGAADFEIKGGDANGRIGLVSKVSNTTWSVTVVDIADNALIDLDFHADHDIEDENGNGLNRLLDAIEGEETFTGPDPFGIVTVMRQDPSSERLTGTGGAYRVTFNREVSSISVTDFKVRGDKASLTLVAHVSDDLVYDVYFEDAASEEILFLDVRDDHDIRDKEGNLMNKDALLPNPKQSYKGPLNFSLLNILRHDPVDEEVTTTGVTFRVDFSKPAHNLDINDFELKAGTTFGIISSVTVFSETGMYLVEVKSIIGSGIIDLDLKASHDVEDINGKLLPTDSPLTEQTYTKIASHDPAFGSLPLITICEGEDYDELIDVFDPEGDPIQLSGILPAWLALSAEHTPEVNSYAGGTFGYLDGSSDIAQFKNPAGLAIDKEGNVFVADNGNHVIRKIDRNGNVSTFAGSGERGKVNGQGTNASFAHPEGIAFDPDGNLFVADNLNHAIRKITPDGVVSTYAGQFQADYSDGKGTNAAFWLPEDVVSDADGNIYVVERGNHLIRKITPDQTVTTFAGEVTSSTGVNSIGGFKDGSLSEARFNSPMGITIDKNGALYVNDNNNYRIRKIDPDNNSVTTFAGSGESGTEDGPGDEAEFSFLRKLAFNQDGTLYVTDGGKIRVIDQDANVTTLTDLSLLAGRDGMAFNEEGDLFLTKGSSEIEKVSNADPEFTLSGNTTDQVGLHEVTLVATDDNGGETALQFTIEVLSREPNLLKIERFEPAEALVESNEESVLFQVAFDRGVNLSATDFEISGDNVEGEVESVVFIVDTDEKEAFVKAKITEGYGEFELNIAGNHTITSKEKEEPLVTLEATESEEKYIRNVPAPKVNFLLTDSEGFGFDSELFVSDKTVAFSGTSLTGSTVDVYLNGNLTFSDIGVNTSGVWITSETIGLTDGEYEVTTKAINEDLGLESAESIPVKFTIDTSIPDAPVITGVITDDGLNTVGGIIEDNTLSFEGTTEANSRIHISMITHFGTPFNHTTMDAYEDPDGDGVSAWLVDYQHVTLPDGTYQVRAQTIDAAGNESPFSDVFEMILDTNVPEVTLNTSEEAVSQAFDITVNFTEEVTGFTVADLSVNNGTVSNFSGTGSVYSATITPVAEGEVTIDIAADMAEDQAAHGNTAADQLSVDYDITKPTGSISGSGYYIPEDGGHIVFVFDEEVTGFEESDIVITNAVVSNITPHGLQYRVFITPLAEGIITVDFAAGSVQDLAGNTNETLSQAQFEFDKTSPDVTITSVTGNHFSETVDLTITFSEEVTGFDLEDITVTYGSASNLMGSGALYTVTITAGLELFPVLVDIAVDVAADEAGNLNTAASQLGLFNDPFPPRPLISSAFSGAVNGPFDILIIFDEDVVGFDINDLTVSNGIAGNFSGTSHVYTATISPATEGNVTIDIASAVAQDDAGNDNLEAVQFSIEYDGTSPGVSVTSAANDPTSGAFDIIITFTEEVTDFEISDLIVGNGTADNFAGSGAEYSVTITPVADGLVTIDIPAGAGQDAATNDNTAATQFTIENDETAPEVSISGPANDWTIGAFDITITFSEEVAGFDVNDLAVGNGTPGSFTGSGAVYTAIITPTADGTVTVGVAAAVANDPAGNDNVAVAQFSIENDETAPTLAITSTANDPVSGTFEIMFTFSEGVTGFDVNDIAVDNGTPGSFTGSGAVYTATISPIADGTVTLDVAGNVAQDAAGNDNTIVTQFNIENDETAPSVTITSVATDPTSGAFDITITFSEDVAGFDVNDLAVGNGTAGSFAGSGDTYTATITPSADGTVTVDVNIGAGQDAAGNDNTAASQFSIDNDETDPAVTINTTAGDPVSGAFTATITFSEAVAGFAIGDISVGNGTASSFAGSGTTYTATITPSADGTVTVDVASAVAQDAAGNDNTAATQFSIENDETPPTVVISSMANDPINGAFDITITFSEPVTGLELTDLTVVNSTASNLTVLGAVYTVTITPTTDGSVMIDLAAAKVQDAAGHDNIAATQFSIQADINAPAAPVITSISDDTGDDAMDGVTSDNALSFTGTAEANSTVEVFIDGNSIGTIIADGAGDWTYDHSTITLADANYNVTATTTDAATNTSALSTALALTVDTVVPADPVLSGISDDNGISSTDIITNDQTLVYTGTAEPFATVIIGAGPFTLQTTTADANGDWTADVTFRPFSSSITIFITATDAAGNASPNTNTFLITIDTIMPTVQSISRADANPTSASSVDFTVTFSEEVHGLTTNNFSLALTGTQNANIASLSADSGTSISVTVDNITGSGTFGLNLSDLTGVTDVAGNALSGTFTGEVYNTNFFPTDITLSGSSILENNTVGDVVAILTTTDNDTGDTHT
ncbi:MAG: hypothetical protein HEP71_30505, partial [Roseivirga sp.]|nr:hypothetical protein [Roseivirga sp.]